MIIYTQLEKQWDDSSYFYYLLFVLGNKNWGNAVDPPQLQRRAGIQEQAAAGAQDWGRWGGLGQQHQQQQQPVYQYNNRDFWAKQTKHNILVTEPEILVHSASTGSNPNLLILWSH